MRRVSRLGAVVVLLALTLVLCVHYGATYDENWPHPSGDQLAEEPGAWDGEQVLLSGVVETVGEEQFSMRVETDAGDVARVVQVRGTGVDAEPGGTVQVFGELSEQGAVQHADRVVVLVPSPGYHPSRFGVSLLGLVTVAGLFWRHWRIEPRTLAITDRGDRDG
ncbi:MAG: hypothetical protein V5A55_11545 [Halovenus sp.]